MHEITFLYFFIFFTFRSGKELSVLFTIENNVIRRPILLRKI